MTEPKESGESREPEAPAQPEQVSAPIAEGAPEEMEEIVGVQYEGVGAGLIMGFIFVCLMFVVGVVWVGINWAESAAQQAHEVAAMDLNYPELRQAELTAARLLNQYEVIDAGQGRYRIPIDRAVDLMVREAYLAPGGNYSQELQLLPGN